MKCILESMPEFLIRELAKDKAQSSQKIDPFWIMSIKDADFGWS